MTSVQVRPKKVPVLQRAKLACYGMEQDNIKVTFSQEDNVKDKLDTLKTNDSVDGGSCDGTPFGRYCWKGMPEAPEVFQRKMHELIEGLAGVEVVADDLVVIGCGLTRWKRRQTVPILTRRDNQMDASTSAKEVAACVRDKPITSPKMYHNRLTPTGSDVMGR